MMKKIGITTIAIKGTYNCGNRLQAYALQEFLRMHGHVPETIRYEADYIGRDTATGKKSGFKKLFTQPICQTIDDCIRITARHVKKRELADKAEKRIRAFDDFDRSYINYTQKCYYSNSDFSEIANSYDLFITGSDQVWNPYYEGADAFYYLDFAPKEKRFSYAPSIAVDHIPSQVKQDMSRWLHGLDHVTIREHSGKALLREEFGIEARLVCDPVFLLSEKQWESVAEKPKVKEPYFAVYILGKKTVDIKKTIRKLEKKYGIKSIDIYTRDQVDSRFAGPAEFLGWIKNAEFVVTDSFHGVAFSVIFNRPMVVLDRNGERKMHGRIDTLLQLTHLGDRRAKSILSGLTKMQSVPAVESGEFERFIEASKSYLESILQ